MVLRYVKWDEILSVGAVNDIGPEQLTQLQGYDGIWHVVIRDFRYKSTDGINVVTAYFNTQLEVVYSAVQEKFDLLEEEDDPRIIETALQDEGFCALLKDYFEAGDTTNPKFFKTLATLACLQGMTLLHFCCEKKLHKCAAFLLRDYSVLTASHPWLQLADPFWQERKWGNTAFSIAAYGGDERLLQILWDWAQLHGKLEIAMSVKDKRKQTVVEIIEERIRKGSGAKGNPKLAFNVVARSFERMPLAQEDQLDRGDDLPLLILDPTAKDRWVDHARMESERASTQRERATMPLALSSEPLQLTALAQLLEGMAEDLKGMSALLLNVTLADSSDVGAADEASARRFIAALSGCARIALKNCTSSPETCVLLAKAIVWRLEQDPVPTWESVALLPNWDEVPPPGAPVRSAFAEAVEELLQAGLRARNANFMFELPSRGGLYLPSERWLLKGLCTLAFSPKRLAFSFLVGGPAAERLKKNLLANFKAYNPLLSAPAYVERALLRPQYLRAGRRVDEALVPCWPEFVERIVEIWLVQARRLPHFAASLPDLVDKADEAIRKVRKMIDQAVLHLAKMRERRSRPGLLQMLPRVRAALDRDPNWRTTLPETASYLDELRAEDADGSLGMPYVAPDASATNAQALRTPITEVLVPGTDATESEDWVLLTFKGSTNVMRSTLMNTPTPQECNASSACRDLKLLQDSMHEAHCDAQPAWAKGAVVLLPPHDHEAAQSALAELSEGVPPAGHRRNQVLTREGFEQVVRQVLEQLPCRKRPKLLERWPPADTKGSEEAELPELPREVIELKDRLVVKRTFIDDLPGDSASETSLVTKSTGERLKVNPRRRLAPDL